MSDFGVAFQKNCAKEPVVKTESTWRKEISKSWRSYRRIQQSVKRQREQHDLKRNTDSCPPDSERYEFHCIWATEVFTPSNVGSLSKSIQDMGWDTNPMFSNGQQKISDWLAESRSMGHGCYWMNGGFVGSSKTAPNFMSDYKYATLPKDVDFCRLSFMTIGSSLTMVTIQFVLSDNVSERFNALLRKTYKTEVEFHWKGLRLNGATYRDVHDQKREEANRYSDEIHKSISKWFSKNIPGHYSDRALNLPSIDLITSNIYESNTDVGVHKAHSPQTQLFDVATDVWVYRGEKKIELRVPSDQRRSAYLFANRDSLRGGMWGEDREQLTAVMGEGFTQNIALWSIHKLLISFERELSELRDLAVSRSESQLGTIKSLQHIRKSYLTITRDVQILANDLLGFVENPNGLHKESMDFELVRQSKYELPSWVEFLRQQDEKRIKYLKGLHVRVGEVITTSGNLLSIIENLRLQKKVLGLSLAVFFLGLVAAFGIDISNLSMTLWGWFLSGIRDVFRWIYP